MLLDLDVESALTARLELRTARVAVVGLGYAGLPMAVALASAGYRVTGFDVDGARVAAIGAGRSSVTNVPDDEIQRLRQVDRLDATADMSRLSACDVALVCVPTPLGPDRRPDLDYVRAAGRSLAAQLRPGMLVVLQSTVPPGTTRRVIGSILAERGLNVGRDYFLAFCPERIDPGNATWGVENTSKLVGGMTDACTALATTFFAPVCTSIVPCASPEVAELAKLAENTYRFINISFVNELAILCDRIGVSVWDVVDAAASKPFAFQPHYPGAGVGGHCIPVVPFHLDALAREHGLSFQLVEAAGRVNASQPRFVVEKLARLLAARGVAPVGARVVCLGVTYKRDVADLRESAALAVLSELRLAGFKAAYADPFFPSVTVNGETLQAVTLTGAELDRADAVILLVPHSGFNYDLLIRRSSPILDTTNYLSDRGAANVVAL